MRICLSISVAAFVLAALLPPAIAVARGMTALPQGILWLGAPLLVVMVFLVNRSLRQQLASGVPDVETEIAGDPFGSLPEEETLLDTGTSMHTTQGLLEDIARTHAMRQGEIQAPVLLEPLPEDAHFDGEVMELEPTAIFEEIAQAEPAAVFDGTAQAEPAAVFDGTAQAEPAAMSAVIPEAPAAVIPEVPAEVIPEAPAEVIPEAPAEVIPEAPAEVIPEAPAEVIPEAPAEVIPEVPVEGIPEVPAASPWLVPQPVPAFVPLARLLDKAWEERFAGRDVQAASWFLTCLLRHPSAAVRDEILMDLCALLKENGHAREALALLDTEWGRSQEKLRSELATSES